MKLFRLHRVTKRRLKYLIVPAIILIIVYLTAPFFDMADVISNRREVHDINPLTGPGNKSQAITREPLKQDIPRESKPLSIPQVGSIPTGRGHLINCKPFDVQNGVKIGHDPAQRDHDVGVEVDKNRDLTNCRIEYPPFVELSKEGGPGYNGTSYKITYELPRDEQKDMDRGLKTHYFNEYVSRKIAVHRNIGDPQRPECKRRYYRTDLPPSSIIITFHNEAWTTLLRTIHSLLDRTKEELLEEIILIDDFSTMDHLKLPLEAYLQPYPEVRLIRATQRLGLIRARNLGHRLARAKIIIFLDSHIEVFPGWIEPLVAPIHLNPKTVTFPIIDIIAKNDFKITLVPDPPPVGSLNLNTLLFSWMKRKTLNTTLNIESPTMPGGLYAISSGWFKRLGCYDPGLSGWGGENIEISLKIWMCGGAILTTVCSHVAHLFRTTSPFKATITTDMILRNSARVAEVWMDHYKHFFYERISYRLTNIGDLGDRFLLKDELKCNNFKWYIDNIFPELATEIDENGTYCGEIRNKGLQLCLFEGSASFPSLVTCKDQYKVWRLTTSGKITSADSSLVVWKKKEKNGTQMVANLRTLKMRDNSRMVAYWDYDKSQRLINRETGMCLDVPDYPKKQIMVAPCTDSERQKWILQTRASLREYHKNRGVKIDWDNN